jgi:trk system potassium uptake protein TrkA
MYIVIVGAGKIGYSLAKLLLEEEHDVIMIEKDSVKTQKIVDELDIVCINDDATKEGVLDSANVHEADAVIVLTGFDEINLIVGMLAKEKGAKKVAIKLSKTNYDQKILIKMGIDLAIHPEAAAANYIEQVIAKPSIVDLVFLSHGNAEIEEILVKKDSEYLGKTIKQLNTENHRIIAMFEGEKLIFPKETSTLKENSRILVIIKKEK